MKTLWWASDEHQPETPSPGFLQFQLFFVSTAILRLAASFTETDGHTDETVTALRTVADQIQTIADNEAKRAVQEQQWIEEERADPIVTLPYTSARLLPSSVPRPTAEHMQGVIDEAEWYVILGPADQMAGAFRRLTERCPVLLPRLFDWHQRGEKQAAAIGWVCQWYGAEEAGDPVALHAITNSITRDAVPTAEQVEAYRVTHVVPLLSRVAGVIPGLPATDASDFGPRVRSLYLASQTLSPSTALPLPDVGQMSTTATFSALRVLDQWLVELAKLPPARSDVAASALTTATTHPATGDGSDAPAGNAQDSNPRAGDNDIGTGEAAAILEMSTEAVTRVVKKLVGWRKVGRNWQGPVKSVTGYRDEQGISRPKNQPVPTLAEPVVYVCGKGHETVSHDGRRPAQCGEPNCRNRDLLHRGDGYDGKNTA